MADWDDENSQQQQVNKAFQSMDVVDRAETLSSYPPRDSYKRNNEDNSQQGERRRRNNGDGNSNYSTYNNKTNDNEGNRGNFNRNRNNSGNSGNRDGSRRRSYNNNDQNDSNQQGGYRRRNNDNQDNQNDNQQGGGYRRRNNDNQDNQNDNQQGGGYRRRNNDNQDNQNNDSNQQGGYRRRNNDNQDNQNDNQQGGGYRRRNNDNQDNQNNDSNQQGGYRRRNNDNQDNQNDNQQGGGYRRRNNDNQDNQNDNQQGGGYRRRNNDNQDNQNNDSNQQGGGYRRRNNDNQDNQNDNQQGGGYRRRNNDNQDNQNDNQQGGGYRRRNNDNQDNQNNDSNQQGGGYRRRNNDNQDGNQQGDRPRRRNREEDNAGGCGPIVEPVKTEEGEPKKERYIPRRYNKQDEDLFDHIGEGINFSNIDTIPVQVSGENIPDPIQKFSDAAQDNSVIEAIKRSNYKSLTPIQKYGIPIVNAGRDLMASAQTGSGKTITFLLPIIEALCKNPDSKDYGDKCSPQCLIITPTRELAIQIYEQALKLTFQNDIKPCVVYGGANYGDQRNRISYGSNLVVATPGRLNQFLEKEVISLSKIKYFVLDEADRMIDQGFIPIVKTILTSFDMPEVKQTLMFSATFPTEVQLLAQQFLKPDYIFLSVGVLGGANADVKQEILEVEFREKKNKLLEILGDIYSSDARILVFCEKKKACDYLAGICCENNYKATSIHGDRFQSQREEALSTFKKGQTPVLFATNVAARGLDIKGVGYVINYDLPSERDEYVHRIGRTGRVGNEGTAISFYNEKDNSGLAPQLVQILQEAKQKVPSFLSQYAGISVDNDGDQGNHDQRDAEMQNENFEKRTDDYKPAAQQTVDDDDW